jgi:hypothetical protein
MKQHGVTVPQIGPIAGTRAMLGAGIALLLSEKLTDEQRRAIGWTLVANGQRSALGSRTAVRDKDAACLWSRTLLPMAVHSFEKRTEKTCRLRARNAPAQLSR